MSDEPHEPFDWDLGQSDIGFSHDGTLRRLRRLAPARPPRSGQPPRSSDVEEPSFSITRFVGVVVFVTAALGAPILLVALFG